MTPEQLMIPRYKVLSLWPACESLGFNKVGDILTDNGKDAVRNQDGDAVVPIEWELFPVLFRKLEWWEERKPEDMPEYVKVKEDLIGSTSMVLKVEQWVWNGNSAYRHRYKSGGGTLSDYLLPATESEYLTYINSKK